MRPYRPLAEVLWKLDPAVQDARQHPAWPPFHRTCARAQVYFDQPQQAKRRSPYEVVAFTTQRRPGYALQIELARGHGDSPITAVADAYRKCGRAIEGGDEALARLLGAVVTEDDFDQLVVDDFDGI